MSAYNEEKLRAYENIDKLELEFARMERVYKKYVKHGAVKAAESLETEMAALRAVIELEKYLMSVVFD